MDLPLRRSPTYHASTNQKGDRHMIVHEPASPPYGPEEQHRVPCVLPPLRIALGETNIVSPPETPNTVSGPSNQPSPHEPSFDPYLRSAGPLPPTSALQSFVRGSAYPSPSDQPQLPSLRRDSTQASGSSIELPPLFSGILPEAVRFPRAERWSSNQHCSRRTNGSTLNGYSPINTIPQNAPHAPGSSRGYYETSNSTPNSTFSLSANVDGPNSRSRHDAHNSYARASGQHYADVASGQNPRGAPTVTYPNPPPHNAPYPYRDSCTHLAFTQRPPPQPESRAEPYFTSAYTAPETYPHPLAAAAAAQHARPSVMQSAPYPPYQHQAHYIVNGPAEFSSRSRSGRRGNLPKAATDMMKGWFDDHLGNPYPTEEEKLEMAARSGLQLTQGAQVSNWFINQRRRSQKLKDAKE
ncbi:homeodomain superfamily, partial [Elasticomyces elasticus]